MYAIIIAMLIVGAFSSKGDEVVSASDSSKKIDFPTIAATLIVPNSTGRGTDAVGRAIASSDEKT
ncbi:hypothetical protein [Paenisporosarcina antarctica]|uniref:Uncharacterized protein n=1 Tax=Paenisporosarcina antarctica TaxID=417367 RepID=A0A4P7A1D9_9BACL|nr:hypothetical protein [Paenisporosarcina antarctica]QBP42483.1 hypothetical protein E2636_15590 [Paenisporosarcina antarctica]